MKKIVISPENGNFVNSKMITHWLHGLTTKRLKLIDKLTREREPNFLFTFSCLYFIQIKFKTWLETNIKGILDRSIMKYNYFNIIIKLKTEAPKLSLILIVFLFFTNNLIRSQNAGYCGVHIAPPPPPNYNKDSFLLDRFGNVIPKFTSPACVNIDECEVGYFTLIFCDVPADYQMIACEVFTELSTIVLRRTFNQDCSNEQRVIIKIDMDQQDPSLASASPYFEYLASNNSCDASITDKAYIKINGGYEEYNSAEDGYIHINPLFPSNDPNPVNPRWRIRPNPFDPIALDFDLYSVLMHEAHHIIGFNSRIDHGMNFNSISFYDKYLTVKEQGVTGVVSYPVFTSNCLLNCWHTNSNIPDLENLILNSCNNSGRDIFVFDNPILGGPLNRGNALVHLKPTCNGTNFPNYLMAPSFDDDEERYMLTANEREILCGLGYVVNNQCTPSQSCFIVPYSDRGIHLRYPTYLECCAVEINACVNEPLYISDETLLCNDASNDPLAIISDLFVIDNFGNPTDIDIVKVSNGYEVVMHSKVPYLLGYTITGCDCKQLNTTLLIAAGTCLDCNNVPPCQNLTCLKGFDDFADDGGRLIHYALGGNWIYEGKITNTPDRCFFNGDIYYKFYGGSESLEAIAVPLQEPIMTGCTAYISFKASSGNSASMMSIYASETYPCHPLQARVNIGPTITNCGTNSVYDPELIADLDITNIAIMQGPTCSNDPNFMTYTLTPFVNNFSFPIRYVIFTTNETEKWLMLDIVVTKDCFEADFTFDLNCNEVHFAPDPDHPTYDYYWEFGDSQTSNLRTPTHTYLAQGTFTVTLTITDACGKTKSISKPVVIDCINDPVPLCNCPTGFTVGINQSSVTNISATLIPSSTIGRNTPICINGKLRIDRSQSFLDKIIYMGEGASIEINNGNFFYTHSSDYHPCNGIMYQGIVVSGGRIAAFNNKIYDAHIGIDFHEGATSSGLEGNTFDRNYIGINVLGGIAGDTRILRNHFVSNGTYLPAYPNEPTKSGTQNKTWAGVNLQFTTLISVNDNNEFFGIGAGVRANKSILIMNRNHAKELLYSAAFENGAALIASDCASLTVNDNLIENCEMGVAVKSSNLSADLNTIDNCGWGFYLDEMNNRNLQISNSQKLYFNKYGIYLIGSSSLTNLNIYSNKLNGLNSNAKAGIAIIGSGGSNQGNANIYNHNTEFSIPSGCRGIDITAYQRINIYSNNITYQSGGSHGIYLQNAPRCFLRSNVITGFKAASPNSIGIAVLSSPYNTYCCNRTPGNGTGIYFSNDCDQSHLKHNIMSDNNFGLQCGIETWIGFQKLGYSNTWPGSAVNFEALHSGSINDMQKSKFDVTNGPSDFFPVPVPPSIWFNPLPGNNKSCLLDFSCAILQRADTVGDDDDKFFRFYNDEDVQISPTDEFTADPLSEWGN
ncbi:MAG: PKD domain-containing protein [Saprospiraceae bacterium]|nr:PKD domain-containing protein [Saprospiraceae bacterium]